MKYIESVELREWVKENLRKTIFQKAHALAVQTGCEVLVKLQDNRDITGLQYYATHNLQRAYINNALRKHPAEMLVSGETGLPHVNQATQIGEMGDASEALPTDNGVVVNDEPLSVSTAGNQTDGDSMEGSGDVLIKMEAMSGDEDSTDAQHQDHATVNEPAMDIDMYTNINPLSRNHGTATPSSSHSPQHLYQCAICQKTFRTINILQMHTQTFHLKTTTMMSPTRMLNIRGRGKARSGRKYKHEQEQRRYPCPMCERTFHHPDLLRDHVSRSHMGQSILASSLKGIQATSTAVTTDTSSSSLSSSMSQSQVSISPGSTSSQGFQDDPGTSDAASLEENVSDGIQISPVKQLIPTETFLGNLGNHPSSLFGQSSSTTPFKHPGGGSSSRNSTPGSNQGEAKGPMPRIKIMKAILAIGGPVSTANTVKDNLRNRNYERVTNELFVEAANQLKDMGLGYLVACKNGSGRLVDVFIKKPPEEVVEVLEAHSGLCDPSVYATTFSSQTPVRLMRSSQLMENLIASGLVAEEHLKPHPQVKPDANEHSFSSMNVFDGVNFVAVKQEADDGGFGSTMNVFDTNNISVPNPDVQLANSSDSLSESFAGE